MLNSCISARLNKKRVYSAWRKGDRSAYLRLKDLERAHVLKTLGIEISL
ncbi:MAG: hypothetical protein K2P93_00010 [Alphaproteobacteria bacterium]|nr:hypothetical protein [Alphaproteobacteria bacterium]